MRRWHGEQICSACLEIYLYMKDCHWGQWQQFSYLDYLERQNLYFETCLTRQREAWNFHWKSVTCRPLGGHPFCKGTNLSFHMHLSEVLRWLSRENCGFLLQQRHTPTFRRANVEQHVKGWRICPPILNISLVMSFVPFRWTDVRWQGLDSKLLAESAASYLSVAWTPAEDDGVVLK